jgi:hypothetical protein
VVGRQLRILSVGALALFSLFATIDRASAQIIPTPEATNPEQQSVSQRGRPDYDPLGIRAGSFLIFPSANVMESWDSNIYATPTDDDSDLITTVSPQIAIGSDWNNNALNIVLSDQSKFYATHTTENVNNLTGAAQGRLDVERDIYFTGGGGYQLLHEDRSDPNSPTTAKSPTEYTDTEGNLGFVHDTGLIGLRLNTTVDSYSYDNDVTGAGAPINEQFRNYILYTFTPRLTYELVPGYHAFIQTPLNERQYVSQDPSIGARRSSHGYEGDAGISLNLGAALNGEAFLGYLRQDYEAHQLNASTGLGGGANLLWNMTDLTSFRLQITNTVNETDVEPASGIVETNAMLTVEHELFRNVLLSASGNYYVDNFSGINRTDNNFAAGLGVKYLLNRDFSIGLDANYWNRNSNAPGVNYDREIIGLTFRGHL